MSSSEPDKSIIKLKVDPANPGQFFACCGLLEIAERLWDGVEGWFERSGQLFCIRASSYGAPCDHSSQFLINNLSECALDNTMTEVQLSRLAALGKLTKKQRTADPLLEEEKKTLDSLWRDSSLVFRAPIDLRIDWFRDVYAGGSTFKTWAGQQSVIDIARGLQQALRQSDDDDLLEQCLMWKTSGDSLPFFFDSDLGNTGSSLDVGFSFDPLKKEIRTQMRPLLELAAFVGLQRFRPYQLSEKNEKKYRYSLWSKPLEVNVASIAASGVEDFAGQTVFEFRLFDRTKYLKSFLPGKPCQRRIV